MCGIAGFCLNAEHMSEVTQDMFVDAVDTALFNNVSRGKDAWGLMGWDYGQSEQYNGTRILWKYKTKEATYKSGNIAELNLELLPALSVHTRAATQGEPKFAENNHPVNVGDTWAVHNGVIRNDNEVMKWLKLDEPRPAEVDSIAIAAIANLLKPVLLDEAEFKQLAEELSGILYGSMATSIMWNGLPGLSFLMKGTGSPMALGVSDKGVIFASEPRNVKEISTALEIENTHFRELDTDNYIAIQDGEIIAYGTVHNKVLSYKKRVPKDDVDADSPHIIDRGRGSMFAWDTLDYPNPLVQVRDKNGWIQENIETLSDTAKTYFKDNGAVWPFIQSAECVVYQQSAINNATPTSLESRLFIFHGDVELVVAGGEKLLVVNNPLEHMYVLADKDKPKVYEDFDKWLIGNSKIAISTNLVPLPANQPGVGAGNNNVSVAFDYNTWKGARIPFFKSVVNKKCDLHKKHSYKQHPHPLDCAELVNEAMYPVRTLHTVEEIWAATEVTKQMIYTDTQTSCLLGKHKWVATDSFIVYEDEKRIIDLDNEERIGKKDIIYVPAVDQCDTCYTIIAIDGLPDIVEAFISFYNWQIIIPTNYDPATGFIKVSSFT